MKTETSNCILVLGIFLLNLDDNWSS